MPPFDAIIATIFVVCGLLTIFLPCVGDFVPDRWNVCIVRVFEFSAAGWVLSFCLMLLYAIVEGLFF